MVLLYPNGSEVDVDLIMGNGANGLVLLHGPDVLKVPLLRDTSALINEEKTFKTLCNEMNIELLEREKEAYSRLNGVDGVARCLHCSSDGILLQKYTHGSLKDFITNHAEPSPEFKTALIAKAIGIIRGCHQKSVLLNDVALRNFLMTDEESIVMIDFGQSQIFDLKPEVILSSADGIKVEVDIFQFGCVIHSLSTWQKYEPEIPDTDPPWSCDDLILAVSKPMYGTMVDKCWQGFYRSMDEVLSAFENSTQQ